MRLQDLRLQPFTAEIRCDRCGRQALLGDLAFEEMLCINLKAGYASVFGDGNDVQVDLCQHCLKAVLGPWLRIGEPSSGSESTVDRLSRFDPIRHGGEFPGSEEAKNLVGHSADAERLVGPQEDAQDLEALASDVFKTPADVEWWLRSPHPLLEGKTPLAVAEDPAGKQRVIDLLIATKYEGTV
jgi:hypothetical protein